MFHNVNNELRVIPKSSTSFDDMNAAGNIFEITNCSIHELCHEMTRNATSISQFASRVLEFSSQYGSDNSISYTACNITGRPSKFPNYGDFPETYAMVSDIIQIADKFSSFPWYFLKLSQLDYVVLFPSL